jgi:hypothetical protein
MFSGKHFKRWQNESDSVALCHERAVGVQGQT